MHAFARHEFGAILFADARGGTELPGNRLPLVVVDWDQTHAIAVRPGVRAIVELGKLAIQLRLVVVRQKLLIADGPAPEHSRAVLEVDRIEWAAPPRPVVGAPAEITQPGRVQRPIVLPHVAADVERLSRFVASQASTLEQEHIESAVCECTR